MSPNEIIAFELQKNVLNVDDVHEHNSDDECIDEEVTKHLEPSFIIKLNTPGMKMTQFELYETTLAVVFDYNCV